MVGDLLDDVLKQEQIELREIRVKYPRDSFFSKGLRRALIRPAGLHCQTSDDELHPQRSKLTLAFELPRGSYATILVKRLTEVS
jgi:tRNA pseudouridine13 synthase